MNTKEAIFFAREICEEVNVHNFAIDCGISEKGNIKLNYNRDNNEWYWLVGEERREIKDLDNVAKIFFNENFVGK